MLSHADNCRILTRISIAADIFRLRNYSRFPRSDLPEFKGTIILTSGSVGGHLRRYTQHWIVGCAIFAAVSTAPLYAQVSCTPNIAININPASPAIGQSLSLTVNVTGSGGCGTPTGVIKLVVDNVAFGNNIPLVNGSATFGIPDAANGILGPISVGLTLGFHSVGVNYSGDANYPAQAASSNLRFIDIVPGLTASANPVVYGQPLTYTATVGPGPTGTVTFYEDTAPPFIGGIRLGNGPLSANLGQPLLRLKPRLTSPPIPISNGQAVFNHPLPLAVGSHTVVAQYNGDSSFSPDNSNPLTVIVNKASTATVLGSSPSGTGVALTATVNVNAPGSGTPTGSVQFFQGSTSIGSVSLSPSRTATLVIPNGSGNFSATYAGDTNFNGSSGSTSFTPIAHDATMGISSSVNPSSLGQSVTFTATVSDVAATFTPTGTVTFSDGTKSLGSAPLSGGTASISVSTLTVGSHAIIASYGGDSIFGPTSASTGQVVNRISSQLKVSASPSAPASNQSVTLTGTITPAPPTGVTAPTGTITFSEGGNPLGTATVAAGTGSVTVSSFTAGTHTIDALYNGDGNWAATRASFTLTVTQGGLSVTGSLPDGTVGTPYSGSTIGATGGKTPYQFVITGLPSGLSGDPTGATGNVTGTPTAAGTSTVTVKVTDSTGASATTTLTLKIVVGPLTVTTATLPDGAVGQTYSATLAASGGVPGAQGYQWSASGNLPDGISLAANGTLSGQPGTTGDFSFTATVTDSLGTKASKSLSIHVGLAPLTITGTPGNGITGTAYSATVGATGGKPPYTFSGTLPGGLSISSAGAISGTPTVTGASSISVTLKDSAGTTVTKSFPVSFALPALPPVGFGSLGDTANPQSQPGLQLTLGTTFPVAVSGTLVLTFQADNNGGDDPAVQFSSGGRTVSFTIPANSSTAVFTNANLLLQTGTVSGLITLTAHLTSGSTDITPNPAPTKQIRINPAVPTISSATATRNSTGFTVTITGFSTTREITQAIFHFNGAPGANLQTTDITVPVTSLFSGWFGSNASQSFGGQFLFTQPFTVSGDTQAIVSVTITLVNARGNSQQLTVPIQ